MPKRKAKPAPAVVVADPAGAADETLSRLGACPVVGIGASAGGLEAFTQVLRALPADTGMAFVLVQHLAPSHTSALAEILSRATAMPVAEVNEECAVAPDHVYVIPPGQNITIAGGRLSLIKREAQTQHHPVDLFFQALAQDLGHRAIGVVLSGTATDGTLGLEEIKAAGGLTFAQDATAQYEGMPRSAINSGCVDLVLSPAEIAAEIARIAKHPYVAHPVPSVEDTETHVPQGSEGEAKAQLAPILRLLGDAMRVDFEQYKVSTLRRRITRRMVLLKLTSIDEYAGYLGSHPGEAELLFGDILINVTSFFRDPATYRALAETVAKMLEGRSRHDPLRIWVPGCSTGEEAYSLAMLVTEATEPRGGQPPLQLFATDLNPACIQKARAGVFSAHALRGLSRDRVRRFFIQTEGDFRVVKTIRDACVFAAHNVLNDPPFSNMDLVSCRNLLIYLEPTAQRRVLSLLHYALRPAGILVLGGSETVGVSGELFDVVDARHKIYRKGPRSVRLLPKLLGGHGRIGGRETPAASKETARLPARAGNLLQAADRLLLQKFAPPGVLVDAELEILQFSGDTTPYLAPKSGKASLNLLSQAREGLAIPLRAAVQRARKRGAVVREEGLRSRSGGKDIEFDLEVIPIGGEARASSLDGFQILFEGRGPGPRQAGAAPRGKGSRSPASRSGSRREIERLERELAVARDQLRALLEHEQAGNEELQSANEEAQSANEELQSINEELQTSKEEIQSSNEELTTVNDELHTRNLEMEHLNNDLTNLIISIDMAVVIVGRDLCIRRFSPAAAKLFRVISSDIGRPISDIRMKVDLPDISELLSQAIDTVSVREREVQDETGTWYSLRIRPYVTLDNKIDGAVVVLVDVDKIRRAREYAESLIATVRQPLLVLDGQLRVQTVNQSFYTTFGVGPDETLGHHLHELGGGQWDIPALRRQLEEVLPKDNGFEGFVVDHVFEHVGRRVMLVNARRLRSSGNEELILMAIEDITDRNRLELELRARVEQLIAAESVENDFLAVLAHELGMPLSVSLMWVNLLRRPGTTEEEMQRGLEVILENTKLQHELIGDLLDAHRISTGKVSLNLQRVDLLAALDASIAAVLPIAREKEIRLERDLDAQPTHVSGDPQRLRQVLSNLLANALKFTPKGGRIQVTLHSFLARVDVSVTDTGDGIAPEVLPRIFERFRQADSLTSRVHGGLGLGLAVAKQLVELHGGVISATSPGKGKGSTFTFSLPLRLSSNERSVIEPDTPGAGRRVSLSGIKVLIVDDEPEARESLRRVFEGAGAEVLTVAAAEEALHVVRTQAPDVLVSEIILPVRSGYELIRDIRALPAESGGRIPAIALTAYPATNTQEWAVKAGFQAYIDKPVKARKLIADVAAIALRARPAPA